MTEQNRLETIASTANGNSVTPEALREAVGTGSLHQLLDEREQPEYLLRGTLLDIGDRTTSGSESDQRSRKVASPGMDLLTLLTDQRVLIVVPREDDAEQIVVPLADITKVETESAPGASERLCLYTDDAVYYIDTSRSASDETAAAREFAATERPETDRADTGGDDPLETLERLADLHERGALSDDEFAQKKAELLDRI